MGLGVGYLDAAFKDFSGSCPEPYNVNTPGFGEECLATAINLIPTTRNGNIDVPDNPDTAFNELTYITAFQDLAGEAPESAPKWSLNFYADMYFPLDNGYSIQFSPDMSYQSDIWLGQEHSPIIQQQARWLVNARLAYVAPDRQWTLALIGRNLTDERYLTGAQRIRTEGLYNGFIGRPRTISIELGYRYN